MYRHTVYFQRLNVNQLFTSPGAFLELPYFRMRVVDVGDLDMRVVDIVNVRVVDVLNVRVVDVSLINVGVVDVREVYLRVFVLYWVLYTSVDG